MTCQWKPPRANQRDESAESRDEPALEAARGPDANQLPHEEPEIEGAGVDQQSLQNVGVPAEVHAAHPAGLIEMGKRAFQSLAAEPQQTLAAFFSYRAGPVSIRPEIA